MGASIDNHAVADLGWANNHAVTDPWATSRNRAGADAGAACGVCTGATCSRGAAYGNGAVADLGSGIDNHAVADSGRAEDHTTADLRPAIGDRAGAYCRSAGRNGAGADLGA
ncbi:hypothetical protein [Brucella sp. IR073]|uniref:hypothetical protein n=1 Tax=unclassified Brucella TaxID=2632610 RepID=UPI003B987381